MTAIEIQTEAHMPRTFKLGTTRYTVSVEYSGYRATVIDGPFEGCSYWRPTRKACQDHIAQLVTPRVGDMVRGNEWPMARWSLLGPCDDWGRACFRLNPDRPDLPQTAVDVELTGRTHRDIVRAEDSVGRRIACRITVRRDGEEDESFPGMIWMYR